MLWSRSVAVMVRRSVRVPLSLPCFEEKIGEDRNRRLPLDDALRCTQLPQQVLTAHADLHRCGSLCDRSLLLNPRAKHGVLPPCRFDSLYTTPKPPENLQLCFFLWIPGPNKSGQQPAENFYYDEKLK